MITVREYKKSKRMGFEVDIRFTWPSGGAFRRRYRAPVATRAAAKAWGRRRETELLTQGHKSELATSRLDRSADKKEIPTLRDFWPRFIDGYCVANRQKPSSIEAKQSVFRTYLDPRFGAKRLDEIKTEDVQLLKAELARKSARTNHPASPKTVNNILSSLSSCLKYATLEGLRGVDGVGIIERAPRIRLLKVTSDVPDWYELHEYRRLVEAAAKIDPRIHLLVLLAGSAGLRRGEIMALKWTDLDLKRRFIKVQRSIWIVEGQSHETSPKGNKGRVVTMTAALADALTRHQHLQGERVLYADNGKELSDKVVRRWIERAQRRAGIEVTGAIHRLRHSFCSMLAAEGATPRAIQELAGHSHITTTMKYMHLSPASRDAAIAMLDRAWERPESGETVEKLAS